MVRRLAALVLAATLGATSSAQQPPQEPPATQPPAPPAEAPPAEGDAPQPPTFRTGINFVRVDVIVTDRRGNPVTDLKAEDFEVREDGDPQDIESFQLFKIDAIAETTPARPIRSLFDEESEAQRPDVRLFAFFLDDYHVRRGSALRMREILSNFVTTQIAPQDMVGIMYPLTPTSDVVMNRNHGALARAFMQFDGRKYDYVPRNQFEEQYANYPAEIVENIRNQVSLSALKGLIVKLGGLREGRKALVLVSEGYTHYLPPQMRDPIATMPGMGNPNRRSPFAGESQNEFRARFFSQAEMMADLREVYNLANQNNVAIYALDPRGLAAFEHDINEGISFTTDADMMRQTMDTIRVLADETDGRAIVNRNDLDQGMKQIVRDSSAYYLLGYNSRRAPTDGRFHEIKVRVKRPGTEVRHRKGYWALTAEETARALAPPTPDRPKEVEAALAAIVEPPRGRLIRTWFGATRGENGKTRVTFVWEPTPVPPGVTRREEPASLSLMAMTEDGQPVFRGRVPDGRDPGSSSGGGQAGAVSGPQRVTFDAPPGPLQLRLTVEDAQSFKIDSDSRQFDVPDLTAPQVTMATPMVYRARSPYELQQIAKQPNPVPTLDRDFHRTERMLIRVQAYGPGTDEPAVTARLLNRAGDAVSDLTMERHAAATYQLDLPMSGIAAGEYVIELRAAGEAGEAKQHVAFRVGG